MKKTIDYSEFGRCNYESRHFSKNQEKLINIITEDLLSFIPIEKFKSRALVAILRNNLNTAIWNYADNLIPKGMRITFRGNFESSFPGLAEKGQNLKFFDNYNEYVLLSIHNGLRYDKKTGYKNEIT